MIREMADQLCRVSEIAWDRYALRNEPYLGKITDDKKAEFVRKSRKCGSDVAAEVIGSYGKQRPSELAQTLGATISYIPGSDYGAYTMFSYFELPNQICLFRDTVDQAMELFKRKGITNLVGSENIGEVMVAHELFHYIESIRDDLYISQKVLTLKGFFTGNRSVQVRSLEEVAAMQFTKDILSLHINPFVFDVLLLYSQNREMAMRIYNYIMDINQRFIEHKSESDSFH